MRHPGKVSAINYKGVWVFNGEGAQFPSAVFRDLAAAQTWIKSNELSEILTKYPLDTPLIDWAKERGIFEAKKSNHNTSTFIQRFTCASLEHYHFENGESGPLI